MKTIKAAPIAFSLLIAAAPALHAQDGSPDADGDGMVSMEEFAAAWPDLAEDSFTMVDANGDGMLDTDEIATATDAGLLPAVDL